MRGTRGLEIFALTVTIIDKKIISKQEPFW